MRVLLLFRKNLHGSEETLGLGGVGGGGDTAGFLWWHVSHRLSIQADNTVMCINTFNRQLSRKELYSGFPNEFWKCERG